MTDLITLALDGITTVTLPIIHYQDQRVLTTELLATFFGVESQQIRQNFNNNKERFQPGEHYFILEGDELRQFKGLHYVENFDLVEIPRQTKWFTLWTKRGVARHSKMLGTERAWDLFDILEEHYFSPRPLPAPAPEPTPVPSDELITFTGTWKDYALLIEAKTGVSFRAQPKTQGKAKAKRRSGGYHPPLTESQRQRIIALSQLEESLSLAEIGRRVGCSRQSVTKVLSDYTAPDQSDLFDAPEDLA